MKQSGSQMPLFVECASEDGAKGRHVPRLRRPDLTSEIALAKLGQRHGSISINDWQGLMGAPGHVRKEGDDFTPLNWLPSNGDPESGREVLPIGVGNDISVVAPANICAQCIREDRHLLFHLN